MKKKNIVKYFFMGRITIIFCYIMITFIYKSIKHSINNYNNNRKLNRTEIKKKNKNLMLI